MTLDEIKNCDKEILTPQDVGAALHLTPMYIRLQAREDASKLGFPVIVMRSRVKIPRIPFLRFMGVLDPPAAEDGGQV